MLSEPSPLDLERNPRIRDPRITQEQLAILNDLRDMYGLLEPTFEAVALLKQHQAEQLEQIENAQPWAKLARLTARQGTAGESWAAARQSHARFKVAYETHSEACRAAGRWDELWRMERKALRLRWSLARGYAAAALHAVRLVGVIDLRADKEALLGWCG